MKELEFSRIGERCYYDTLPNGLPVYVLPKPGFSKSFAFLPCIMAAMIRIFA